MAIQNLPTITPEELTGKRHTGMPEPPALDTLGMQTLMDAHADLNTDKINALAEIQNANNNELSGDISAHAAALAGKVDKVPGKGLSQEDYTTADKSKLAGIQAGANNYSLPMASDTVIGGIKIGIGLEILGDGTVNGVAAPAPDLIARQQISDLQDEMLTKAPLSTLTTAILLASDWEGEEAPYTQMVTVTGVTASDMPDIAPVYSSNLETRLVQREAWNLVGDADSGEDTLTFTCDEEKPTTDIPIQIRVVG